MAFPLWRAATNIARKQGVDPSLFRALIRQESGGRQYNTKGDPSSGVLTSSAGALGYAQLIPTTASGLGVDPTKPRQNLRGGARYLAQQLDAFDGNVRHALAAYNAGPNAVTKYGGIPPYAETQNYVKSVLALQKEYPGKGAPGSTGRQAGQPQQEAPRTQPQQSFDISGIQAALSSGDTRALIDGLAEKRDFEEQQTETDHMHPATAMHLNQVSGNQVRLNGAQASPLTTQMTPGSEFGVQDAEGAPAADGKRYHAGKDWFAPGGSRVNAPVNGRVVEARFSKGNSGQVFGGTVKVQGPDGRVHVFRHVDPRGVKVGDEVRAGDIIASVSDWTDGSPHAHVELWRTLEGGYRYENLIDPVEVYR